MHAGARPRHASARADAAPSTKPIPQKAENGDAREEEGVTVLQAFGLREEEETVCTLPKPGFGMFALRLREEEEAQGAQVSQGGGREACVGRSVAATLREEEEGRR